jgi:hypothetical protein
MIEKEVFGACSQNSVLHCSRFAYQGAREGLSEPSWLALLRGMSSNYDEVSGFSLARRGDRR